MKLLKTAFKAASDAPFSADLVELAWLLRWDGRLQVFGFEGHENIVVDKNEKWVSVDIGVPMAKWQDVKPEALGEYLAWCLANAIPDVAQACRRHGIELDQSATTSRLQRALAQYRFAVRDTQM